MARKKMIPDDVRERVIAVVNQFNEENVKPAEPSPVQKILQRFGAPSQVEIGHRYGDYVARFRGAYLYLDRIGFNQRPSEICRLKWTGDFDNWEFAIYKHSRNYYDSDEWFFPGAGEVDGTIVGAMRAGKIAYPD
jgi:hypothetical protein